SAAVRIVRTSLELIVARAGARAAFIGGREQRSIATGSAIQASPNDACHRTPRESRVNIQHAAERPAADNLFQPIPVAAEEDRLPRAKKLERLADVIVAASVI